MLNASGLVDPDQAACFFAQSLQRMAEVACRLEVCQT